MDKSKQGVGTFRTAYLIAQARYVLGMAKADASVAKAAGSKVLGEFESDLRALESQTLASRQNRQEGKALTMHERRLAEDAIDWIVSFRRFYRAAIVRGEPMPALPAGPPSTTRNSTKLALEVGGLLKSGREYAAALAAVGCGAEFVAQGEQIMGPLLAADEKQEVVRFEGRAEERRKLLALKHRVYAAIKALVAVGRSVYAKEPVKSRLYNMRLLYRGLAESGASPPETPAKEAS